MSVGLCASTSCGQSVGRTLFLDREPLLPVADHTRRYESHGEHAESVTYGSDRGQRFWQVCGSISLGQSATAVHLVAERFSWLACSSLRKCTDPEASPATIVTLSGATAQETSPASAVKVTTSPVPRSHTLSVWSSEAETACFPSGVIATAKTPPLWPVRVRRSRPVARSHTLSVLSYEAETACFPSGVTATALTQPVWPVRVRRSRPVARCHTLSVSSSEAETACLPSGVTATALTTCVWPVRVRRSRPVA